MKYLIGDSGLIGKNLLKNFSFDATFNSKNIDTFRDTFIDGGDVYLSCLPATKWNVNKNKLNDLQNMNKILDILSHHTFANIILISTIDVYLDSPLHVDETYNPDFKSLHYGTHRLLFEKIIKDILSYKSLYIIRLPALFGDFLKKNVLYDLLNNNCIENINRNTYYQWYNLNRLHIDFANILAKEGGIYNLFTSPIYTGEIVDNFFKNTIINSKDECIKYDWKTKHNNSGYIQTHDEVLCDIEKFIYENRNK
jgi:hypothetical protein